MGCSIINRFSAFKVLEDLEKFSEYYRNDVIKIDSLEEMLLKLDLLKDFIKEEGLEVAIGRLM